MTQQEIDQAIREQIGADPTAPVDSNPLIGQALTNYAKEATNLAAALNTNEQTVYLSGFNDWANQVKDGRISNANPPQPPPAWAGVTASDGWAYVIRTTDPVCQVPPIPPMPQAPQGMTIAIGTQIGTTGYWAALPQNANVPPNYTTPGTASDGTVGIFQWDAFPFGGWWKKVG